MKFSVVMPAWNEGPTIAANLRRLRDISAAESLELILVDGNSSDNTVSEARKWVDKLEALDRPNRGAQLNAGARLATGDLLFFLHADTQLVPHWQKTLERFWLTEKENASATVFSVDYGSRLSYRFISWWQNQRVRWRQAAYGDQGLCTTAEMFARVGGFPEIPLMEDVVFCRRLRQQGPIVLLKDPIYPSARRLRRYGLIGNGARNFITRACFSLGVSPQTLWKRYYSAAAPDPEIRKKIIPAVRAEP